MVKEIGKVKLDYQCYPGSDLYCDGSSEDELLEIVKNHSEEEYGSIIEERNSWPILYHLSHMRKNIVEWIPIEKNHTVLEVGSGCGAITGCLADKAGKVTCIELSEKRSLINAYRNQNRDNIEILLGNFQDVERKLDEKYDYITLIGVLEYGASYISGDDPYATFLKVIKKHLKQDGKLVIAIENKLGMKYWAGCREDHTGKFFESIEGYPNTTGVRTFSKQELEQLIRSVGFSDLSFYYPYPDYKLPQAIYSDAFLPNPADLYPYVLNYDADRWLLFDEGKAFASVLKENAFPMFSNSFLVIAGNGDKE